MRLSRSVVEINRCSAGNTLSCSVTGKLTRIQCDPSDSYYDVEQIKQKCTQALRRPGQMSDRGIQRAGQKRNLWTGEAGGPSFDDNFFSFHDRSTMLMCNRA